MIWHIRALDLFYIKYGDKEEFLDVFEKEYLTNYKGYRSVSLANHCGILRSSTGNEGCNWKFKDIVLKGEVLKARNFLTSLESYVEVTSYFANDKCAHEYVHYHKLADSDKKNQS